MEKLIDTHTHLDFSDYDPDRNEVLKRSRDALDGFIAIGIDLPTSKRAVVLAEESESARAAVGIHPHEADKYEPSQIEALRRIASHPKVAAIGECGLDYYRDRSDRTNQSNMFAAHIDLALELQLPLVIHLRDAYHDGWEMLHEHYIAAAPKITGIIHSFSGGFEDIRPFLNDGWFVGINGIATYPNATELQSAIKEIPLEMMVVETDCPFLAPQSHRGQRNEPSFVIEVADKIAELKGTSIDEVVHTTTANAKLIFKL